MRSATRKLRRRNSGFPLILCGITMIGLLSALVDSTLGWGQLAHAIVLRTIQ